METRDDGSGIRCNEHPDAPHGFMRDASHSAGRYVCECESWEPPKNKPMTRAEWKEWLEESWNEAQKLAALHGDELKPVSDVKEFARAVEAKEWVGLTDEEVYQAESGCWFLDEFDKTLFARAIEAKLKEKNT